MSPISAILGIISLCSQFLLTATGPSDLTSRINVFRQLFLQSPSESSSPVRTYFVISITPRLRQRLTRLETAWVLIFSLIRIDARFWP